jgi:hypothetical protein
MLGKYSFGIGDRFYQQGIYLLDAFITSREQGIYVTPVWNKSYREHQMVHTHPDSVRKEADETVEKLKWSEPYLVDADHVTKETVSEFLPYADFFTLDVGNQLGHPVEKEDKESFIAHNSHWIGKNPIPELDFTITRQFLVNFADSFLSAIHEVESIYDVIKANKKDQPFFVEISMDEVEVPQHPFEILFILKVLSDKKIPVNTIAPKFVGSFLKGVDYVGDLTHFQKEFESHLKVIRYAVQHFDCPPSLKLSIHTGSDKFSLYPIINALIKKYDCGLHLKTAGTTWLEEYIGVLRSGAEGLAFARDIACESLERFDELTSAYQHVLNIDRNQLPTIEDLQGWNETEFFESLYHDPAVNAYNPSFRQLIHTAYKLAAARKEAFIHLIQRNAVSVGKGVKRNILERHLIPLFQ